MTTAKVYRPTLDWKGQRPADLEDSYLGDVTGLLVGGSSSSKLASLTTSVMPRFPNVVSMDGQMGLPFEQESGIILQKEDILVIRDKMYRVASDRIWEDEHAFAGGYGGFVDDYYFVDVEANT